MSSWHLHQTRIPVFPAPSARLSKVLLAVQGVGNFYLSVSILDFKSSRCGTWWLWTAASFWRLFYTEELLSAWQPSPEGNLVFCSAQTFKASSAGANPGGSDHPTACSVWIYLLSLCEVSVRIFSCSEDLSLAWFIRLDIWAFSWHYPLFMCLVISHNTQFLGPHKVMLSMLSSPFVFTSLSSAFSLVSCSRKAFTCLVHFGVLALPSIK